MKAFILIHVRPGCIPEVIKNLKRIKGVVEAHMTFGPYDVVAVVEVDAFKNLGPLVASEIQALPCVIDTITCLVVESE